MWRGEWGLCAFLICDLCAVGRFLCARARACACVCTDRILFVRTFCKCCAITHANCVRAIFDCKFEITVETSLNIYAGQIVCQLEIMCECAQHLCTFDAWIQPPFLTATATTWQRAHMITCRCWLALSCFSRLRNPFPCNPCARDCTSAPRTREHKRLVADAQARALQCFNEYQRERVCVRVDIVCVFFQTKPTHTLARTSICTRNKRNR